MAVHVSRYILSSTSPADEQELAPPLILSGPNAFYKQEEYEKKTKEALASKAPLLPPAQRYDFQSEGSFFHSFFGKCLSVAFFSATVARNTRLRIDVSTEWKHHRFSLLVSGYPVDATLIGRESTLSNGRWLLIAQGLTLMYESRLINDPEPASSEQSHKLTPLQKLLMGTDASAVLYNYPGMGASQGPNALPAAFNAHEAFLRYIENELHATEVIDDGHSLGGSIQASVWQTHSPKQNISYVLVKDRACCKTVDVMRNLGGRFLATSSEYFGWNMDTIPSSDHVQIPEIHVMTVGHIDRPRRFSNLAEIDPSGSDPTRPIYNDKVIPCEASSAMYYLAHPPTDGRKKIVIGVPDEHPCPITEPGVLAEAINEVLGDVKS